MFIERRWLHETEATPRQSVASSNQSCWPNSWSEWLACKILCNSCNLWIPAWLVASKGCSCSIIRAPHTHTSCETSHVPQMPVGQSLLHFFPGFRCCCLVFYFHVTSCLIIPHTYSQVRKCYITSLSGSMCDCVCVCVCTRARVRLLQPICWRKTNTMMGVCHGRSSQVCLTVCSGRSGTVPVKKLKTTFFRYCIINKASKKLRLSQAQTKKLRSVFSPMSLVSLLLGLKKEI